MKKRDFVEEYVRKLWWELYNFNRRFYMAIVVLIVLLSTIFYSDFFMRILNFKPTINYQSDQTVVHFIDVGQGKAIAIQSAGYNILIDTGPSSAEGKLINYLDHVFFENAVRKNVFDYVLLTHLDSDHSGNVIEILERYTVHNFYRPQIYTQAEASTNFSVKNSQINDETFHKNILQALELENCSVDFCGADKIILDDTAVLKCLAPTNETINSSSNSMSAVLSLEVPYKVDSKIETFKFLFTGDITDREEEILINRYQSSLDCDVLDIAHHGSYGSSSLAFLRYATPTYAVFSYGENNYGMPAIDVVNRLETCGVQSENMLSTFEVGTIAFYLDDVWTFQIMGDANFLSDHEYGIAVIGLILAFWGVIFFTKLPNKEILYD